jgi:hypothetical protein
MNTRRSKTRRSKTRRSKTLVEKFRRQIMSSNVSSSTTSWILDRTDENTFELYTPEFDNYQILATPWCGKDLKYMTVNVTNLYTKKVILHIHLGFPLINYLSGNCDVANDYIRMIEEVVFPNIRLSK